MNNSSTEPLRVRAEGGFVVIDGPGGVIAPLFPAAAICSGEALHGAGATAYGQFGAAPSTAATSIEGREGREEISHSCDVHLVRAKRAATDYLGETMTSRANLGWGLLGGLALAMSGCATPPAPVQPPPVVATLPPPPPPMPAGGYIGMKSPTKRADGTYVTPNLDNTEQAAVWHLRNALNVAALGCDQAGGGVVEPYNAWIKTHAAVIDRYYQAYIREWQAPGWWDWQRVYDDNQTRIYNFYAQPAMRAAFCAVARVEIAQVGQVADDDLPAFARAALLRLDRPFVEFYAAYDAWRDYYQPAPPPVVRTIDVPIVVSPTAAIATLGGNDTVAADTETSPALAPGNAPIPASPSPR